MTNLETIEYKNLTINININLDNNGEKIYGFSICSVDENNIDSCYGYGDKEYMIQEAKDMIDCRIEDIKKLVDLGKNNKR